MIGLPGRSHRGPLPPFTPEQIAVRERLRRHVHVLAGDIGERNLDVPGSLERAGSYIEEQFSSAGYTTGAQEYRVRGLPVRNIDAQRAASGEDSLVVGAHYDSVPGCPGAN